MKGVNALARVTFRIRKQERGLWFRFGDFHRMLGPGKFRFWSRLWSKARNTLEIVDTLETRFEHPMLDVILADPQAREAFVIVDLDDEERALIWKDGRLEAVVGPGRHAFWKEPFDLAVEKFRVTDLWLEHAKLPVILRQAGTAQWLVPLEVKPEHVALVFRDGELVATLGAGLRVFWKDAGRVEWRVIDQREQTADVAGQEIMTRDKVTLRLNLVVSYKVEDPLRAVTAVADQDQALYREAQLVLRAAIGTRNLENLLTDKESVGAEVRDALTKRAREFGVTVTSVGLRDIVLPGDMKAILNQVITAEKQAQANLILRREETAAARSQANTAKLIAANPVLARMKEMEQLKEVLAGAKASFILGGGDLAEQVRGLIQREVRDE